MSCRLLPDTMILSLLIWYFIPLQLRSPTAPHVFIASSTHVKLNSSLCTWYSIIARRRIAHNGKMSEPVICSTPGSDRWAAITEHSAVHWRTERNLNIEYEKDHFLSCLSVSICRKLAFDRNEFVYSLFTMLISLKTFHPYKADVMVESLSHLPISPNLSMFSPVWAAEAKKEVWCLMMCLW